MKERRNHEPETSLDHYHDSRSRAHLGRPAGCDQFDGGGWLRSANVLSNEKATFGINGKCRNIDHPEFGQVAALHEGQFEYYDHGTEVRFHGDVQSEPFIFFIEPNTCKAVEEFLHQQGFVGSASFHGNYRPQRGGAPGEFSGFLTDGGEPGFVGDTFSITLFGGQYDGYTNTGPIEGGNIQVN
jgi:hypothetical protein